MQRGIGGTVYEPEQPERRDREVTLGPFTLMLIGCLLVAICGLCFLLGIAVGHRNAESSTAISVPPAAPAYAAPANAQSKPSAGQGEAQAPVAPTESADATPVDSETAGATAQPDRTIVASQPAAQTSSGASVQPALAQSGTIMVQIAAVEHSEDADVLVGALRKHGYAVAARRDPSDGLLHVQVGPFATRSDAYAMRQKLLNDGYNAIVQQ